MNPEQSPARAMRKIVTCPTCGGESIYALDNPFRPFCSERCRLADLGKWLSGDYRVAGDPLPPADDGTGNDETGKPEK